MTGAALSLYIYGLYLVSVIALPLLLFPHFALGLLGLSAGDDVWIRFTGVLAGTIGGIYIAGVLTRTEQLYGWSVPARYASAVFLAVMVVLGKTGMALLIIAAIDALTASITWVAIKADAADAEEDTVA